jgi:hypothetical protein
VTVGRWALPAAGVLAALAMSGFAAPSPSEPADARPALPPLRTSVPVGGVPEAGSPLAEELVEPLVPPEDDSTEWLVLSVAGTCAVLAAGFLLWTRRRGDNGPAWTPAYVDARAPSAPAATPGGPIERAPIARGERELTESLRRLAAGGVGAEITQQVDRLFARPDVTRDALVAATVHFRDQLAGTGWEHELLTALNMAGVGEIRVAEGEIFDGRSHEAVDRVPAPASDRHDRIAQVVRCGYLDEDRVLRPPRVVVYRADGPAPDSRPPARPR